MMIELLAALLTGLVIGGAAVFVVKRYQDEIKKKSARLEAERIINKAKAESAKIDKDSKNRAKDFEVRARKNVEVDIQKQKSKIKQQESQLERRLKETEDMAKQKQEEYERSLQNIRNREEKIAIAENRHQELEKKAEAHIHELNNKLATVATMTADEAKRELLKSVEDAAKAEAAQQITKIEEDAKEEAQNRVRRILSTALSRYASEYVSERTVSVLALPNEEMKGKIIGREGRNIRTLESLCGVDLIVDDTPEAVVISGFDPVRREVAKRTLEKLMEDGRVHPARIEEVVDKVRSDFMKNMKEDGEKACIEMGIPNVHPEIVKLLGSLKYRMTHQQNCYHQAIEVGHLAGLIAAEVGANVKLARRAGLLHAIGKAIDHTVEGSYAVAGAEYAKKYGESDAICHAIRTHDGDEKPTSMLDFIVQTACIISNSRPGARRAHMDNYIHRLEDLESIGNSFDGVIRTFAVQAGKEVRILVESSRVTDEQSTMLSRDIARKIEREMNFTNQVKVTVLRETRAVEMAR